MASRWTRSTTVDGLRRRDELHIAWQIMDLGPGPSGLDRHALGADRNVVDAPGPKALGQRRSQRAPHVVSVRIEAKKGPQQAERRGRGPRLRRTRGRVANRRDEFSPAETT